MSKSFEIELWRTVIKYLNDNKKQTALYTLLDKLDLELKNIVNCNNFIDYLMKQDLSMSCSSDILVHVLNGLSPIKHNLSNWDRFVAFSTNHFIHKFGEKKANRLIKMVII